MRNLSAMIAALILGACFACLTGCGEIVDPHALSDDEKLQANAASVVLMVFAADPETDSPAPAPEPSPGPEPGVCPDCDGTGETGDPVHRVTCGMCNGTGKVTGEPDVPAIIRADILADRLEKWLDKQPPVQEPVQEPVREVELHTTREDGPGWPAEWWRDVRPELKKDGVKVSLKELKSGAPHLIVRVGSQTIVVSEFEGAEALKARMEDSE